MEKQERRFNLVDEPWIPISGKGLASLRDVFTNLEYPALGGNPIQKIALTKFLLGICQAAATPKDDQEWAEMGVGGLADAILEYLDVKKDLFWLFGERPFLQMKEIGKAGVQPFGAVEPFIATGNTTVLLQTQNERELNDAAKARLVIQLMGFGLAGKKTDNSKVLTPGYKGKQNEKGKPSSGKAGSAIGYLGYLHFFLTGPNLLTGLWLNLATVEAIAALKVFTNGVGTPPWEMMPEGEDDEIARSYRQSFLGRLVPLSRFVLLAENGLHYSEGIAYPNYKDGVVDPSVAVDFSGKDPKVVWTDPDKRPWRSLPALLSFLTADGEGLDCYYIKFGLQRARQYLPAIGVWSAGLRVSSNAGEQYVSGTDDYVESNVVFESKQIGEAWFANLQSEMGVLENFAKVAYASILNYHKALFVDGAGSARLGSNIFWDRSESRFQDLVNACPDFEKAKAMRGIFASFVHKAYDSYCPRVTSRQIDAWAENRPNLAKYIA